ncbi:MAG: Hsp20/alpha crystallin family protein [Pseudomonadales bacterium]|nr:Hsp20/alpha crystallin family protein [Pseudomonadales bacterium]
MTLATLNPWQVLDQIQKEAFNNSNNRRWHPASDISESESCYQIAVDLPGVNPESVSIEVHEQKLHIKGQRVNGLAPENKTHYNERVFGDFNRVFRLPKDADESAINAKFELGVLNVWIPKIENAQPRKITIEVN